jgi:hypothetical protein
MSRLQLTGLLRISKNDGARWCLHQGPSKKRRTRRVFSGKVVRISRQLVQTPNLVQRTRGQPTVHLRGQDRRSSMCCVTNCWASPDGRVTSKLDGSLPMVSQMICEHVPRLWSWRRIPKIDSAVAGPPRQTFEDQQGDSHDLSSEQRICGQEGHQAGIQSRTSSSSNVLHDKYRMQ